MDAPHHRAREVRGEFAPMHVGVVVAVAGLAAVLGALALLLLLGRPAAADPVEQAPPAVDATVGADPAPTSLAAVVSDVAAGIASVVPATVDAVSTTDTGSPVDAGPTGAVAPAEVQAVAPTADGVPLPAAQPVDDHTLAPAVETEVGALAPVVETVGGVVEPVVGQVAGLAGPVVERVVGAASDVVAPLAAPVADLVWPLVEPVVGRAAPVLGAVAPALSPVVGQVIPVLGRHAGDIAPAGRPAVGPVVGDGGGTTTAVPAGPNRPGGSGASLLGGEGCGARTCMTAPVRGTAASSIPLPTGGSARVPTRTASPPSGGAAPSAGGTSGASSGLAVLAGGLHDVHLLPGGVVREREARLSSLVRPPVRLPG